MKAYEAGGPTDYTFELFTNVAERTRTQVVNAQLSEDGATVIAYSPIGPYPEDSGSLVTLLRENLGYYSRLAIIEGTLVQAYRYPLQELESMELMKALDEVSQLADYYERKYYAGRDLG